MTIPLWILQYLTQFLFVFSVITLPTSIISLIYGAVTGQIRFTIQHTPSPFERKEPNPAVGEKKPPWIEAQEKLLGINPSSTAMKPTNNPTPSAKPSPTLDNDLSRLGFTALQTETPPSEANSKRNPKRAGGRPAKLKFQPVEKMITAEVTKDFEATAGNGIPIVLKEGTKIPIMVKGVKMEVSERSGKDKAEELRKDENLGVVIKEDK